MTFNGTVASDFMKLVYSRASKSELIDYAGTDFDEIRLNLVKYIQAMYPLDYNNFVSSDLGGMLIDLVAYVGAVTSMKADFLANENYLRTAQNRNSVKKLLELIGVRMKGPISAVANATISLENEPLGQESVIVIPFNQRVLTLNSPEDGQPLSFALYKVQNGLIEDGNAEGSITLTYDESDGRAGLSFSNLVLIEGALVKKTGRFGPGNDVKFIDLDYAPVIEKSVQVVIEGNSETAGIYREVENLFFVSGQSDKIFQVIPNDDFKVTLVFGDNILSKAPAPNDTFTVYYRSGGGSRGNVAESYINAPIQVDVVTNGATLQKSLTLENSTRATGGANSETIEHAKRYAPLAFRRQDRIVTLNDFDSFVNSFISSYGSVAKATAVTRRAFSSANIIDLYVLEKSNDLQLKRASPNFKKQLIDAIEPYKMLTDEVVVVDGLVRTLDLVVSIRISKDLKEDEEILKQSVASIILDYFNVDKRSFGQEFNPQDLARKIFELPLVIFATVDNYPEPVRVDFNEFIQINNFTINVVRV